MAIDAKRREDGGWNIYKHGGRLDTGIDAIEWAKKVEALGAGEILLTSMDCDGTKAGYDLAVSYTHLLQMREQGNLQKKKPGKSRPKRRKNVYEKQSCLFTTINITENNGEIVKRM